MNREPLVSVVLPVYNGERFLGAAIESLLAQTLSDFEVIIVDDGSTDGSAEIYNSYQMVDARIRVIRQTHNVGIVAALNTGLTYASGRYIARLDHDDMALPQRLEIQVKVLSDEENVGFVGSTMIAVDDTGQNIGYLWHPETSDQIRFGLCFENEIGHPTVMYKADVLTAHGLRYDDSYPAAEDYALWAVASRFAGFYNIRQPLVKYRIHRTQISKQYAAAQRASADRISAGLLRSFNPDLALSSPERELLSILYHFCLRKQIAISTLPDFLPIAQLGLAAPPGDASGIETVQCRRLLHDLLRRFLAHYDAHDEALRRLCN